MLSTRDPPQNKRFTQAGSEGVEKIFQAIFRNRGHYCTPTMKYQKEKLGGKNPIYYSNKKNKVPRNKFSKEIKDLYRPIEH